MKLIKIIGGKRLEGDIYIQGSKNASLGVIVASLLSNEIVVIKNVPYIKDILTLLDILKYLNVKVEYVSNILIIDSRNIEYKKLDIKQIKDLRASYYLMGVMLSLFKKCEIYSPGGCNLGNRPIDMHLDFFESHGVNISHIDDLYSMEIEKPNSNTYRFKQKSVGASINALLFSTFLEEIILENISIEPEVMQVVECLRLMGHTIQINDDICIIKGKNKRNGFMISIIPDRIEAGTYALVGAALAKEIRINQINIEHLKSVINLFDIMNVNYEYNKNTLTIYESNNLKGIEIETNPYPSFPTDLQQPLTSLLCVASENSVIKDSIYKDRIAHIDELNKMNANILIKENTFYIEGNRKLKANNIEGKDLRGGASLVLAALLAKGTSYVKGLKYIERGYSNFIDNLLSLGANISVIEED